MQFRKLMKFTMLKELQKEVDVAENENQQIDQIPQNIEIAANEVHEADATIETWLQKVDAATEDGPQKVDKVPVEQV